MVATGDLTGYSLNHDPLKHRALAFGGGTQADRGAVIAIDLATGVSRVIAEADASLWRRDHGATFEPTTRTLFVAGGTSAGIPRGDVVALDLLTGTWRIVAPDDPAGPAARSQPVIHVDPSTGMLDLAGGVDAEELPELRPWELDLQSGAWIARPSLTSLPPAVPGVSESTVSIGSQPSFFLAIDPGASLPGALQLITVQSTEPHLRVALENGPGPYWPATAPWPWSIASRSSANLGSITGSA